MGNSCNGVKENESELTTGDGVYNYKKCKVKCDDPKGAKFFEISPEYKNVKPLVETRQKSYSSRRAQKDYNNGNVEVVLF